MMRRAVFLMLLLMASVAHAQRGDNILLNDGKTERGEITEASPDAVTVMIRNRPTPIKVSSIKTITFEKEPSAMRAVRDAIRDGQLDQAVASLERIEAGSISRDLIRQEHAFLQAQIKVLQAKDGTTTPGEAITAIKKFRSSFPKSWRSSSALESHGDLAMQTSDFKTAAVQYAMLGKISSGETKLRSMVRSGDALRAMGDSKSMGMYVKVIKSQATTPAEQRQQQLATVGAMTLAAAGGKTDQAIAKLNSVIAENDASDVELFGRAYNALGDCYRSAKKPTDAALAYLHTDLLFYRDADVHAESLYWLSKLWGELGKSERANQARNMLRQRYPTSRWVKK